MSDRKPRVAMKILELMKNFQSSQEQREIQADFGKNEQIAEKFPDLIINIPQVSRNVQNRMNITTSTTEPDAVASKSSKSIIIEPIIANSECVKSTDITEIEPQYTEEVTIIEPPGTLKQKTVFIFNNINQKNVNSKCKEVKEILKRRYLPWLSMYLVTKRICNERHLHHLYVLCLECFNSDPLYELIELETIKTIKTLLIKPKTTKTRELLKNMGHWLGLITLAREKPLPFDLKTIVTEARVKGPDELAFILPFVLKTLESCDKSKVYSPKSLWTGSIMSCLTEIHQMPDLQLVWKCQIDQLRLLLKFEHQLSSQCVSSGVNEKTGIHKESNLTVPQESAKIQKPIIENIATTGITEPNAEALVSSEFIITDVASSTEPVIVNSACAERPCAAEMKPQYIDEENITEPPETVQKDIISIFNNTNLENVQIKCAEVKKNLKRKYLPWLAKYLTTRICNALHLHFLFMECLKCFNSDQLNEMIVLEATKTIKTLLIKSKTTQTKEFLKNMGHWLGLLTLAEGKPVPFDLKTMVLEARINGSKDLAFILPFVTKTLESCSKSKVYGPKTQWTISMMDCLSEINQMLDLKSISDIVIKFEIEQLCMMLNFEYKRVSSSENLKPKIPLKPISTIPQESIYTTNIGTTESDVVASTSHNLIIIDAVASTDVSVTQTQNNNDETIIEPTETVQQKIMFIFQNLRFGNLKMKCTEVKQILQRKYLPWLSQYLVTKLIASELKSHALYIACLKCFNSEPLNDLIESETTKTIKALLVEPKTYYTKTTLRNLGHWLGKITIARDKPVPFDLENMMLEANAKGADELASIIPFMIKTLESSRISVVYSPTSAWTMSVVTRLAVLSRRPDLNFNYGRQITVLCKLLKIKPKGIFRKYE